MPPPDVFFTTNRITQLARSGLISSARKLFDEMPARDTVSWNAMLSAYSRSGLPHHSLSLFSLMRSSATSPDHFTFTAALSAASDLRDVTAGTKLHSLALRFGFFNSLPVANSIVDMYGKCAFPADAARAFEAMEQRNEVTWCSLLYALINSGLLAEARHLFDEMCVRNLIAWNIMITGCAVCGEPSRSLELFKEMLVLGFDGDASTFSGLMSACTDLSEPCFGCMIHSYVVQLGWISAVEVSNSILSFYAGFGFPDDAMKVFESMGTRSQVSWNAMMDALMKDGDLSGALSLFKKAPDTNIISWTSLIAGLTKNGQAEGALTAFVYMTRSSLRPDNLAFGAVLHASAILTALGCGKMLHSSVIRHGFRTFIYIANGLVNMYAKCGDIKSSRRVFDGIHCKDIVSWNAMILGFALHGRATEAFEIYNEMVGSNVLPDKVTFVGLLMACSHSGLTEKGRDFFYLMEAVHGMTPDADHITCIVDMIARSGHLKEASKLIHYNETSTTNSFEALLSASAVKGDVGVGRKVGNELLRMDPERETGYVMLSNLYCASGQWTEAQRVRKEMVERGVKKAPGCSWIEVRERLMVFMSGSRSLTGMQDVHKMLGCLESELRNSRVVVL